VVREVNDIAGRKRASADLLVGEVGPTLVRLATPMAFGLAAVILFNVVDTLWVGRLGARELAAMSFTFPVVFTIMSLAMGLGIGTTSVVARAIGAGDRDQVRRLTSHALLLSVVLVTGFALLGLATVRPLFTALGADAETVELIADYMVPWYLGIGLVVVPMVGNAAIRATGDTKSPSVVMVISGLVNLVLDPILIFGLGPFPRLELQGAAIATVVSYGFAFAAGLWILGRRLGMIEWALPRLEALWASWRQLLYVGAPAALTNMLLPLSTAVITRVLAAHGASSVAAFGVGSRIEALSLIGMSSLSIAIAPFVGQNHGAGRPARVAAAIRYALRGSLILGGGIAAALALLARPIASLFTSDPEIAAEIATYLWMVPVSYGLLGASMIASSTFNAVNRPLQASAIVGARVFILAIPLTLAGSKFFGVVGVFAGIAIANGVIGLVARVVARRGFPSRSPAVMNSPTIATTGSYSRMLRTYS
jgi:putative MATE family efflux protein